MLREWFIIKHKDGHYWRDRNFFQAIAGMGEAKHATKFATKVEAGLMLRMTISLWNDRLSPGEKWKIKDFTIEPYSDDSRMLSNICEGFTYKCTWQSGGATYKGWKAIIGLGTDFSITGLPCSTKKGLISKCNKLAK